MFKNFRNVTDVLNVASDLLAYLLWALKYDLTEYLVANATLDLRAVNSSPMLGAKFT